MKMRVSAAVLVIGAILAPAASAQDRLAAEYEAAYLAWDRGDYVPALEAFIRIVESPGGERFHERIALITGELYPTIEVSADGRAVRLSPDGRFAAYETGTGAERSIHLVDLVEGGRAAGTVKGTGLVFSPAGDRAVYLALRETPELAEARRAMARAIAETDRPAIARGRALIGYLEAKNAVAMVRDLASGRERRLQTGGLIVASLTFSADGGTIYAVAGRDGDASRSDIYVLSEDRAPVAVTTEGGHKSNPVFAAGGEYLIYQAVPRSPIPRDPTVVALAQVASGSLERVVVHELATGRAWSYFGAMPVVAADGSAVAFLSGDGEESLIQVIRPGVFEEPITVARTAEPVTALAISPDGEEVAYQRMPREDWEIFVARTDGSGEFRLTHDIQHDLSPRYLSPHTLLVVKGEGRHRRSYLYDTRTREETRLFHNNTVRTIAPEYEWQVGADGSKVLIVAERDGDTVSPERGVYLTDLSRQITKTDLLQRLRTNLAAERDLRERGEKIFAPIAEEVRAAVAEVSKSRLYSYQDALFKFESKHITRPGNRKAAEYLFETLKGWGYEPEYQWFEPVPGVRTANVVARLPGTVHPELIYVVGSHYDSVERGAGADDNTSGTAVLLETARILKDRPLAATVLFVFFTGEESGLLGSREFARRAVAEGWAGRVRGALNNDMMGFTNDHRLDNTIRYSNAGIRDVQHAAAFLFSDLITYDARYYKSTDAHALFDAFGDVIGGIGSYPVLANPHYHQPHDVLETINHELLRETTKTNVASVMLLASSPGKVEGLEARRRGRTVEVRWSPARERDVREYIVAYGPKDEPLRQVIRVAEPHAVLQGVTQGMVISVKAVNQRGLEGWDWAQVVAPR